MSVLLTGMTPTQCGSKHQRNHIFGNTDAVRVGLEALGLKVSQTNPKRMRSVDEYELIIAGIYGPMTMVASYAFDLARLLTMAFEANKPVLLFVDDWHLAPVRLQTRRLYESMEQYDKRARFKYAGDPDLLEFMLNPEVKAKNMHAFAAMLELRHPIAGLIMPVFAWHMRHDTEVRLAQQIGMPLDRIFFVDPSNMLNDANPFTVDIPVEKERAWVLAGLYDQSAWAQSLKIRWPLTCYGHRRSGLQVLPEIALIKEVYANVWGVLSYPYPSKNVGWWRNRYQFAAKAGCVLYADNMEAPPDPSYSMSLFEIEALSSAHLADLAARQAAALRNLSWTRDKYLQALQLAVATAMRSGGAVRA